MDNDNSTSPVEVLVFDLGGVLLELNDPAAVFRLETDREEFLDTWLHSPTVRAFESGLIEVSEFATRMVEEAELPYGPAEFLMRFDRWPHRLFEGTEELLLELTDRFEIALLSNTNARHWHQPGVGEEPRDLADAADVLRPVLGREAEVRVEAVADVVAVQDVGESTALVEGLLGGHGDRALARAGESREPDRAAALAEHGLAIVTAHLPLVPRDVGRLRLTHFALLGFFQRFRSGLAADPSLRASDPAAEPDGPGQQIGRSLIRDRGSRCGGGTPT